MKQPSCSRYREIAPDRAPEILRKGLKASSFFPHKYYFLPKCGPDGFKLATRLCGPVEPDALWEIVLYATGPTAEAFPDDLYFDSDLVWHQQQFGKPGQVATANLAVKDGVLYSMVHVSDLVQRIGRRREFKTRIENRFRGWPLMLLEAVLTFAVERGIPTVMTPTSDLAIAHTDRRRNPGRELFERVYDRSVSRAFEATRRAGWWAIDVARNRDRIVLGETRHEPLPEVKTICICHDIERGLGHLEADPPFSRVADATSRGSLGEILQVEAEAGVRTSYCVVGSILAEERTRIEAGGHCIAFHSYDHTIETTAGGDQLRRCREVDYRIKGYRLPQSKLTPETTGDALLFHNFEWLASSRRSLGFGAPEIRRRLVTIPIAFDDYPLYEAGMAYDDWERRAFDEIERSDFVAFGLHDCYAPYWLPGYRRLLDKLKDMGTLRTLDQVAAEVAMRSAR